MPAVFSHAPCNEERAYKVKSNPSWARSALMGPAATLDGVNFHQRKVGRYAAQPSPCHPWDERVSDPGQRGNLEWHRQNHPPETKRDFDPHSVGPPETCPEHSL
ncbi:hypothetical protein TREES_T100014933 [Tupaia chinensis]|uniref:Uncharacterized protein n=1 Tax=Tupaia chinensis TaxID=246437 RepID=L9KP44_TUPCH|nr:hypothetical protein TREES_T100014933 [Tupaia chinensis]